ncbi:MAG: DUF992 domain-containing protein [Alphaproteobacteria bacterium]|nr:DUF992 domain-containing protein [Alphaproteobacteria bacterium]
MRVSLVSGLILSAAMFFPAAAQNYVAVGTLTCTGGEGVGLILGSKKSYRCTFSANAGPTERYSATVTKIGLDIGITGETVMLWTVLAATNDVREGMLAGNYAGAAADAAIGIGGGANVLVGGSTDSVVLQPVSVQGQTGLNIAVGIAGMTLR